MSKLRKLFVVLLPLCLFLSLVLWASVAAQDTPQPQAPTIPTDTPSTLVDSGVANMTIQGARVWWWYTLPCAPTRVIRTEETTAADWRLEEISRIATTGGITRTLFLHEEPSPYCGDWAPELLSNVAADGQHLYWMSNAEDGLVKLSINANVGDAADLLYDGQSQADEIEERGSYVYLMNDTYGIIRVHKNNGSATPIVTPVQLGGNSRDIQLTNDYVYWNNSGFLKVALNGGGGGDGIVNGVTAYVAENSLCRPSGPCPNTEYVFMGLGDQIRRYDLDNDSIGGVLYDSPASSTVHPTVVNMTVDEQYIYFFERREASCEPFCSYDYGLYRIPRTGGTAELLYYITEQLFSNEDFDLTLGGPDNDYLFWHDEGQLRRLPRDAAAIPSVDVFITDIEVTQAIQDLDNSIQLIQEKRTGVRVHVDAAGQNVPGIAARLSRINSTGTVIDGPIYPSGGTNYLTVPNNPDRANFNHAFYFELPKTWVDDATLRLRAEVNPTQLPPEPTYANNVSNTSTFSLRPSPTLRTHLLAWNYEVSGTEYEPDLYQDVYQARSWIRRTYPLASTTGGYDSPDPGFRLDFRYIVDDELGGYVLRTSEECLEVPEESREFCAAGYANNYAQLLRATEGIPEGEMIYSMIWDDPSLPFPRGFATGSVSAGPTGTKTWFWDYDGSYGDWYMGHEVGHNVGRGHPSQGNSCGHSASDPNFPHTGAAIGEGDMWGFDVGDIGLNSSLNRRVYPNTTWRDLMSYCNNQWISDYTYEEIYDFLTASRTTNRAAGQATLQPARAGVGYIALFGTIFEAADTAAIQLVSLWDSPGPYTPPSSGPYRMRFLGSGGNELAGYDFNGEANDANPSDISFGVVVPFPTNTAEIELIRKSDGAVLDTHTLSANPPTISNVQLIGAASPVTDTIRLQWQASDPDGDSLTFDVYYSDDNGATYTAYALGITTNSVELDTNQMGGSNQAHFRVTANDGTRTAEAESPSFTMANKPPTVVILTPQDGLEVVYGTAVNFTAEVEDLQGHVLDGNMQWYVNGSPTGIFGPDYTAYLLPVGTNEISLRATNTVGLMSEASATVLVNDDLEYPGPTLSVGPDQVSWQVAAGTVAPQQAVLSISNSGTGDLSWMASESASWLSLSTTNGSTPGMLTLTADPTAVTPGEPVSTLLTISGDNGQTVQLPVSLLVGQSPAWFPPAADATYGLYLPVSLR